MACNTEAIGLWRQAGSYLDQSAWPAIRSARGGIPLKGS
jgi:hypothetical protein